MIEYDYCNLNHWTMAPKIYPKDRSLHDLRCLKISLRIRWVVPTSSKSISPRGRGVCFWINCLIGTVFVWSVLSVKTMIHINTSTQNNAKHVQYRTTKFVEQQRTNQTKTCQKHVNQRNNLKAPGSETQENTHPQNLDLELVTFTPIQASKKNRHPHPSPKVHQSRCCVILRTWRPHKTINYPSNCLRNLAPQKIKVWFPHKHEPLVSQLWKALSLRHGHVSDFQG